MQYTLGRWCETRDEWKRKPYRKFVNICGATPLVSRNHVADLGQGRSRLAVH